ncbi:molybdate ABC transporter substrate-binding protein [Pseudofrankia asymbiotica]|uniref:Molybdate ABC transporter substrate-binding protein n=1 Tax=Pseudofrankia asymbiotica TaxID=1834516 RepID=A0A1V2I1P9_9ACTN|nr:molybdate ABC transporter substrate-binding protein [Pseudofrankia asymbiotica]
MTVFLAATALALGAAACGDDTTGSDASAASSRAATATATKDPAATAVTVFAAASLTETFTTLADQFEAAHPGADVKLNFAASSALAQQIIAGAPADVFASASNATMKQVTDAKLTAAAPTVFVRNSMEIAVPPSNPARIANLADLARPGVKVALCEEQVPCGATGLAALRKASVTVRPATLGQDVKSVLSLVQLGEVDAALVYRTDVSAAGDKVLGVEIPDAQNASTDYPIATLTGGDHQAAGKAFADFVLSSTGIDVLGKAGFGKPQ